MLDALMLDSLSCELFYVVSCCVLADLYVDMPGHVTKARCKRAALCAADR